nr:hypothetical protein [Tanacetum cinerariifolium]
MDSVSNTVSKPILIPSDEFSDDTPSQDVARKFLNEVKDTIVTLQRVVKSKMALNANNWSSPSHQEIQKIFKDEIASIVNQVDNRQDLPRDTPIDRLEVLRYDIKKEKSEKRIEGVEE